MNINSETVFNKKNWRFSSKQSYRICKNRITRMNHEQDAIRKPPNNCKLKERDGLLIPNFSCYSIQMSMNRVGSTDSW